MAVLFDSAVQDLSTAPLVLTTAFGSGFKLGTVTFSCAVVNGPSENPVHAGLQENVQIWLQSSAGSEYDALLFAGSYNGRQSFCWVSAGSPVVTDGSQLIVKVTNLHKTGTAFVSVHAEAIV